MRSLVALLLLANLFFFAISRGWLAPALTLSNAHEREPQRLQTQIDPQSIRLLSPDEARAAVDAASAAAAPAPPSAPGSAASRTGP